MLTPETLLTETAPILHFIEKKWDELLANARSGHDDRFSDWRLLAEHSTDGHLDDLDPEHPYILYLPNDFVTPGGRFMVQFYWDSYFILPSLIRSNRFTLAKGIVDNCLFLVERHGMVIANRKRWAAGSQLPFLSQMVRQIYEVSPDKTWLRKAARIVEEEFAGYWMNSYHLVHEGLSRYHAPDCYPAAYIGDITIDHEASWDLSPRFDREDVLQLLPIDLNCNLFAYENDLAFFCDELEDFEAAQSWRDRAQERAQKINDLMWDEDDQTYYDYDFVLRERKKIRSLACFFPLRYRIANAIQARAIATSIGWFEKEFGLATCDQDYGYTDRQWNYPLGWAPLHILAYLGLANYGYKETSRRIALKWLTLNLHIWKETGKLFEKYDVETGTVDVVRDRYNNQEGFAWTNGVFESLVFHLTNNS